jgi:hypothetical protein
MEFLFLPDRVVLCFALPFLGLGMPLHENFFLAYPTGQSFHGFLRLNGQQLPDGVFLCPIEPCIT